MPYPSHFRVSSLSSEAKTHIEKQLKERDMNLREYFQWLVDYDIRSKREEEVTRSARLEEKMDDLLDQITYMEENVNRQLRSIKLKGQNGGALLTHEPPLTDEEEDEIGVIVTKANPTIRKENLDTIDEDFDVDF